MNTPLKINGLIVDANAIGAGIYKMICERDEEALVAFGMIPKWAMDCLEKLVREKIIELAAKQINVTPAELAPFVSKEMLTETMQPIVLEVSCAIYQAASDAGKMIV